MMIAGGLLISLAGCFPQIDDAAGLAALQPTLAALGQEVIRVDDDALNEAYRNHAATWQAAVGD